MCQCRYIQWTDCGHTKEHRVQCKKYEKEAEKLKYKLLPCLFALVCPSTTTRMAWQNMGKCERCLSKERLAKWETDQAKAREVRARAEHAADDSGISGVRGDQDLSPRGYQQRQVPQAVVSSQTPGPSAIPSTQRETVYGPPKRYSWLEMKPLPLVPGRKLVPQTQTWEQGSSSTTPGKLSRQSSHGDLLPEGMSVDEYLEEVELLWQRAGRKGT